VLNPIAAQLQKKFNENFISLGRNAQSKKTMITNTLYGDMALGVSRDLNWGRWAVKPMGVAD